jgi:hypothetical protein
MVRWRSLTLAASGAVLLASAPVSPSMAGCGPWSCVASCGLQPWYAPPVVYYTIPCAFPAYPPQPVYRVEQGPVYNVVVVPYEAVPVHYDYLPPRVYLPPRFFADCGCYR